MTYLYAQLLSFAWTNTSDIDHVAIHTQRRLWIPESVEGLWRVIDVSRNTAESGLTNSIIEAVAIMF